MSVIAEQERPVAARIRGLRRGSPIDEALELIGELADRPQLARPAAALVRDHVSASGDEAKIGRVERQLGELGVGVVEAREEAERLRQQFRSTFVSEEDFAPGAALLDELVRRRSSRDLWKDAGRKMTLDVIAVLLERSEGDPWARRRLRRGLYDCRGQCRPEAQRLYDDLPWLEQKVEQRVGRPQPGYLVRLGSETLAAIRQPHGALGLVLLATVGIVLVWAVTAIVAASRSPAPAEVVGEEPAPAAPGPAADAPTPSPLAAFLDSVRAQLASLSSVFERATIVVLPTAYDTQAITLLTECVKDAAIVNPSSLRRLGVNTTPPGDYGWISSAEHLPMLNVDTGIGFAWIMSTLQKEPGDAEEDPQVPAIRTYLDARKGEKFSLSPEDLYLAQLRVEDGRPVFEIVRPKSSVVVLRREGDEAAAGELPEGCASPSLEEYLRRAENYFETDNAPVGELFLRLIDAWAATDADWEKTVNWRVRTDQVRAEHRGSPVPAQEFYRREAEDLRHVR